MGFLLIVRVVVTNTITETRWLFNCFFMLEGEITHPRCRRLLYFHKKEIVFFGIPTPCGLQVTPVELFSIVSVDMEGSHSDKI